MESNDGLISQGSDLITYSEPYHRRDLAYMLAGRILDSMRADLAKFNSTPVEIMCYWTWENKN